MLGREVEYDVRVTPSDLTVYADPARLRQLVANLLDNASRHSPAGGTVLVTGTRAGGQYLLEVQDQGLGVPAPDRERVFELFRRAGEQDQPGEGIGLAHVRSLIRNLGGDVTVESELGRGSTFILTLPTDLTKVFRSNEQ